MEKYYELKYHELEPDYWFFSSRRDLIRRLVSTYPKETHILEIGCASGVLMRELGALGYSNIVGVDISEQAIAAAHEAALTNVYQADAGRPLGFASDSFDLVISSDVLEHIGDDRAALGEWHRVLRPGGSIILMVPAYMFLWSEHDLINAHFRRYEKANLLSLFEGGGFSVGRMSYWNFLLFFPISLIRLSLRAVARVRSNKTSSVPSSNLYGIPKFANELLKILLRWENRLITLGVNFPFGVSLLICAKKTK